MYLYEGEGADKFESIINRCQKVHRLKAGASFFSEAMGLDGEEYGFNPNAANNIQASMPDFTAGLDTCNEASGRLRDNTAPGDTLKAETPHFAMPEISTGGITADEHFDLLDYDMSYMQSLMNEINRKLYPNVVEILNEYDYEDSPIFNYTMDREFVNQLVDRVLERAASCMVEVSDIHYDTDKAPWNKYRLLRGAVELMLLNELFGGRRPRYRKVCGKRGCC